MKPVLQFFALAALMTLFGAPAQAQETKAGDLVDFHLFEAEFSRAAMDQADETWLIADATKFGRNAPVRVCPLSDVDLLITDADPPQEFERQRKSAQVRLLTPAGPAER